jgi:hypothetical protein
MYVCMYVCVCVCHQAHIPTVIALQYLLERLTGLSVTVVDTCMYACMYAWVEWLCAEWVCAGQKSGVSKGRNTKIDNIAQLRIHIYDSTVHTYIHTHTHIRFY